MLNSRYSDKLINQSQFLVYVLISILVFEGVLRKLFPPLSILIFFLKDIICFYGLFLIKEQKFKGSSSLLIKFWKQILVLAIPILLITGFKDPILIIFGGKQYFLFVIVAILTMLAFPEHKFEEFKRFISYLSFLILPTTIVAILQLSLPQTHWLNLSVTGGTLSEFSSNGKLRVQSTFSFTGQYGFFLNGICMVFGARIFLIPNYTNPLLKFLQTKWFLGIVGIALIIGIFITGGRTSVLGCSACLGIGLFFLINKSNGKLRRQTVASLLAGGILLAGLRIISPEFFEVYERRSENQFNVDENEDFRGRFYNNFLHWIDFVNTDNALNNFFGNGLGVMSNGTENVSTYAKDIKNVVTWTEQDLETVGWEGGIFLIFIYYGFRIYMIFFCVKICNKIRDKRLFASASLLLGEVVFTAMFGNMAKQPPVSIWFFLAIGLILAIERFDDAMV